MHSGRIRQKVRDVWMHLKTAIHNLPDDWLLRCYSISVGRAVSIYLSTIHCFAKHSWAPPHFWLFVAKIYKDCNQERNHLYLLCIVYTSCCLRAELFNYSTVVEYQLLIVIWLQADSKNPLNIWWRWKTS